MLNLNYIIIGMLPPEEQGYLEANLKKDGLLSAELADASRDAGWTIFCRPKAEVPEAAVDGGVWKTLAKEGILVSGDAGEISRAAELGMAALRFLAGDVWEDAAQADMCAEGLLEVDYAFLERVFRRHHHLPWTILNTERCVVKEFSMEYLDALFELYAGEGMTDYIAPLYPYEQEREYQQSYIECMYGFYGYGMWIVCDRDTGRLIGRAGVECREELGGEPELGYVIGVPYQRQGYATEVCEAILLYAREELALPFVNCLIEEGNRVSEHVAEKLGFSFEQELLLDGKRMRKYRYRLF